MRSHPGAETLVVDGDEARLINYNSDRWIALGVGVVAQT